jgi:enamine deaminase RidA (YjgF/YER057c/UK114 family)
MNLQRNSLLVSSRDESLLSVRAGVDKRLKELFLATGLLMCSATASQAHPIDFDKKLKESGVELPSAAPPVANCVDAVRVGSLLFLSGHAAVSGFKGKLGKDMTTEEGYQAARSAAISAICTLKQELGDLNKVKRIVKVMGMVNSTPEYTEQHLVVNGFSDLMVAVFGEKGRHARSAVGMGALPFNFAVDIDLIVEVE